jgi:hypothetical protein
MMAQTPVKPGDWPGQVVVSLTALWDAMDIAQIEIYKATQEEDPTSQDLERLQEEFTNVRYQLTGFLLNTLAPEKNDVDSGTAEREATTTDAEQSDCPATPGRPASKPGHS